jgi:hypothetical protein
MSEQICPVCGCRVGSNAYKRNGVLCCCHSCATGGQCECGCCEEVEPNEAGE